MNEDLAELAELMGRFFAAVSFEKGGRPSYGDLPSLVTEGARLVKTTPPDPGWSCRTATCPSPTCGGRAHALGQLRRALTLDIPPDNPVVR